MKFFRYWWWLTIAFLKKHWLTLTAAMLLGIAAVSFIIKYFPYISKFFAKETKVGILGKFTPASMPPAVSGLISSGLTRMSPDGRPKPNLAISWEINQAGTEYVFHLDPGRRWTDSTPVKAADLIISIENVAVEIRGGTTVVFKLSEVYSPFPALVSRPLFKKNLIGLGPGKVQKTKFNGEFIEEMAIVNPQNQKIVFKFYTTGADLVTGFKLGEVDEIWGLTAPSNLPDWDGIEISPQLNFDKYSAVFFNTGDNSLADKTVRQALTYAIPNKPAGANRALSPVSPLSFAYNPGVKPYDTNQKLAKQLLSDALDGQPPANLELTTTLPFLETAEEIAAAWSEIGVKTTVKAAAVIPENFQAILVGQERTPDPDQYPLWHSTQPSNITHYSSPKVDKLLEDGRRTMDENKRLEIYRDFQRFLVEDSPAAFLEHLTTYNIKRK